MSYYCLSWDSYKKNICNGFVLLQQQEQFVDMTLVADGHSVKVHKNMVALASPLIKEMILSAPCKHPIIFLSNVSHKILNYILEYIYTGEVKIDPDKLQIFLKAAQELSLCGIDIMSKEFEYQNTTPTVDQDAMPTNKEGLISNVDTMPSIMINTVPANKQHSEFRLKQDTMPSIEVETIPIIKVKNNRIEIQSGDSSHTNDISNMTPYNVCIEGQPKNYNFEKTISDYTSNMPMEELDVNTTDCKDENCSNLDIIESHSVVPEFKIDTSASISQQYTVSNKGALQLILNRYIYYMHHQASKGLRRRWRCIDYRLKHCPAYVDTYKEAVIARKNIHAHPFHDNKIMAKVRRNQVYGTYDVAVIEARSADKNKSDYFDLSESEYLT